MNGNQAAVSGNKSQNQIVSQSRLKDHFSQFQNLSLQNHSPDSQFLDLFQNLFQRPEPSVVDPPKRQDHSYKDQPPVDRKPQREREEIVDSAVELEPKEDLPEKTVCFECWTGGYQPIPISPEKRPLPEVIQDPEGFEVVPEIKFPGEEVEGPESVLPEILPNVPVRDNFDTEKTPIVDLPKAQVAPETKNDDQSSSRNQLLAAEDLSKPNETVEEFLKRNQASEEFKKSVADALQRDARTEKRQSSNQASPVVDPKSVTQDLTVNQSTERKSQVVPTNLENETANNNQVDQSAEEVEQKAPEEGTIFDRGRRSQRRGESVSQSKVGAEQSSIQRLKVQQQFTQDRIAKQQVQQAAELNFPLQSTGEPANLLAATGVPGGAAIGNPAGSTGGNAAQVDPAADAAIKGILKTGSANAEKNGVSPSVTLNESSQKAAAENKKVQPTTKPRPSVQIPAKELVQRLSGIIRQAPNGTSQIRLQVAPVELGAIELSLQVRDGIVTGKAVAENVDTQRLLLEGLDSLRNRLAEQGLKVDRFEVDLGSSSDFSQSQSSFQGGEQAGWNGSSSGHSGSGDRFPGSGSSQYSKPAEATESESKQQSDPDAGKWAVDVVV